MSLLRELWTALTPSQRRSVLAAQAICFAMAFSTVTGIAAIAPFFAVLGNPRLADRNPLLHWAYVRGGFSSESAFVIALGGAFVGLVLIANLLNALGVLAMNRLAVRIGNDMKTALFEEYLARPYLFHIRMHSAELFDRIVYETSRVTDGVLQSGFVLVTQLVTGGLIVASVLLVRPVVATVMFLGLGGGYLAIFLLVRRRLLEIGRVHSRSWSNQARIINESCGAIREILLLRDRGPLIGEFARESRTVAESASHIRVMGQIPKHVMECMAVAALVVVALVLGEGAAAGAGAWLGELTFIAFAAYRLLPTLQQVFVCGVRMRADRAALALIAADLRMAQSGDRAVRRARHAAPAAHGWCARPHDGIRLRHVSFRYSPADRWALEDVSLDVRARSMVGLIGANGSGKTTLLDVLAGLIPAECGTLQVDELTLGEADREAWQEQIAYVPQNVFLLDASIARNIAFGISPRSVDPARIVRSARLAQLEALVASLPGGYEHRIGERGIELSGGQRQRIGIARALYRRASVLLLDEPANGLDGASELELIENLQALRAQCTIVLVSHRPIALRSCDVIYELDQGRIRARGTYVELTRSSGLLRRMSDA